MLPLPSVQDRPLSHAGSPLIQDVTDSHAAPPSVQDRPLSHAGSPLIQDVTDSHAAPPSVQDRPLSHASSAPFLPDGSKTEVGQQSQFLSTTTSKSYTCKLLDVHLQLSKQKDTTSIFKAVDNTKGIKFYFESVKKNNSGHSSSFAEDQPQPLTKASNPPFIQDQSPFQVHVHSPVIQDRSLSQVHSPVTQDKTHFLVDSPQLLLSVESSTVEEQHHTVSPLQLDSCVTQNESSSTHSLNIFQDQSHSRIDPSLVKTVPSHPLISDSNILNVHLSLVHESNSQHKPKGTGGLKVYSKPQLHSDKTSEGLMYSHPANTTAQVPEVILSGTEEFEDMEINVMPSTSKYYTPMLPFPQVSVEWYRRQYTLSVKNLSRESLEEPYHSDEGIIKYVNRSRVHGTLEDNIEELKRKIETAKDNSFRAHLCSLVKVGEFIVTNGLFVKTQDTAEVYGERTRKAVPSAELYNIYSGHLNLLQVYIHGTAYLVYSPVGSNVSRLLETLISLQLPTDVIVNTRAKERLKDTFKTALEYMDTHRDRQVLKAVMTSLTSTKFAAELQGISSRQGTASARKSVVTALKTYDDIKRTSQIVRNDLTNKQQYQLQNRIISARKLKEIKTIAKGRGRKLKIEQFPQLATALEYAFGELDVSEGGGGGLESHPRLTTGTLYRSVDNVTAMKRAREILLSLAPEGFSISLSCCYNYTNNYRRGSLQAKRHHANRQINADLSLKKPPRIGVPQLIVNLHWTTGNVNMLVDSTLSLPQSVVMSKDAKSIILADSSPVQLPGPSWKKKIVLPDHTWDQSRTYAITPMTYLFLKPVVSPLPYSQFESLDIHVSDSAILQVTRSGQGVTLLNLSFFEPDKTYKCLNEVFLLLSTYALAPYFRDKNTKQLKKEFTFVVDNGPAEQPSCPLVQICLVRLLRFLQLDRIVQVSFAEYHSKRNYVERVHAEENRVLSKHGPFSSTYVHKNATVGSLQHRENMEEMATKVQGCISSATFGGEHLLCYRGIKPEDYIFSDESQLTKFLSLSEENKPQYSPMSYQANSSNKLVQYLHYMWNVPLHFSGSYLQDHQLIYNELIEQRTSWRGKYVAAFYSPTDSITKRYELQPLPDYIRWMKTGELHYLPFEETTAIYSGPWMDIPDAFLPTKILDLCFNVMHDPPEDILKQISFLAWIPLREVKEYKIKLEEQLKAQVQLEQQRLQWKQAPIYRDNTKQILEGMCRQEGIPATPTMSKHQLCSLILQKRGQSEPPLVLQPLYSGRLSSISNSPSTISQITVAKLKTILRAHNLPYLGGKDELVLRVFMLKQGRAAEAALREKKTIERLGKTSQGAYHQATAHASNRACLQG